MANTYRGEIDATLDGKTYRLCLTLGALAELEDAFSETDMIALVERFESGRISARDCVRIVGAGLRGGGHDIADQAVAHMRSDLGAAGFVDIVARLLTATFGATDATQRASQDTPLDGCVPSVGQNRPQTGEEREPTPFPGKTS